MQFKRFYTILIVTVFLLAQTVFTLPGTALAETGQTADTQTTVAGDSTNESTTNSSANTESGTKSNTEVQSQQTPETVTVSLTVTGKNDEPIMDAANVRMEEGATAYDLITNVANRQGIPIGSTYYEEYDSYFINSIDGLTPRWPESKWSFQVNGSPANVGVSSYVLKDGDEIGFTFVLVDQSPESGEESSSNQDQSSEEEKAGSVVKEDIATAINEAANYINGQTGAWVAVAFSKSGREVPESYLKSVKEQVKKADGKFGRVTDYEKYIIGILAAGGDPTNIAGYNLVEHIYNGDITMQGLNGVIYGLIALDSAGFDIPSGAKWTRDELVNYLIDHQNGDGGWTGYGGGSSVDITAMALTALSEYRDQTAVGHAIESGVNFLAEQSSNVDNSSSAAQMIIALTANGIDPTDNRFNTAGGLDLVSNLLSFQKENGGFSWKSGDKSNAFSTKQPLMALVAYQLFVNNSGALYEFSWHPSDHNANGVSQKDENRNKSSSSNDKADNELPQTATSLYNELLLGGLLLMIGLGIYIYSRRKKA